MQPDHVRVYVVVIKDEEADLVRSIKKGNADIMQAILIVSIVQYLAFMGSVLAILSVYFNN